MHVQPTTLVPTLVELFITYIALFTVEYAYYFCNNMVRYKTGIFRGIIDARNEYDGVNNLAFTPGLLAWIIIAYLEKPLVSSYSKP